MRRKNEQNTIEKAGMMGGLMVLVVDRQFHTFVNSTATFPSIHPSNPHKTNTHIHTHTSPQDTYHGALGEKKKLRRGSSCRTRRNRSDERNGMSFGPRSSDTSRRSLSETATHKHQRFRKRIPSIIATMGCMHCSV